jgi:hypothetical protein
MNDAPLSMASFKVSKLRTVPAPTIKEESFANSVMA